MSTLSGVLSWPNMSTSPNPFTEHIKESGPVKKHLAQYNTNATSENVIILHQTARGVIHLQTLEALYIREFNPSINTKDEYRRRELTIKV